MMRASPARVAVVLRWHLEREGIQPGDDVQLEQIVLAQRERAKTVREMAMNSQFFFRAPTAYDEKAVRKHVTAAVLPVLLEVREAIEQLGEWTAPNIHAAITGVAEAHDLSLGALAQPIRISMCGGTVSPPIDATLAILGKAESLSRLERALSSWS
jgi:glutamyl-tRNA synthetase